MILSLTPTHFCPCFVHDPHCSAKFPLPKDHRTEHHGTTKSRRLRGTRAIHDSDLIFPTFLLTRTNFLSDRALLSFLSLMLKLVLRICFGIPPVAVLQTTGRVRPFSRASHSTHNPSFDKPSSLVPYIHCNVTYHGDGIFEYPYCSYGHNRLCYFYCSCLLLNMFLCLFRNVSICCSLYASSGYSNHGPNGCYYVIFPLSLSFLIFGFF